MTLPANSPPRWGSIPKAAETYGVCTRTIRRRIRDGTIRAYRFGPRMLRVDLNDVERAFVPIAASDPEHAEALPDGGPDA